MHLSIYNGLNSLNNSKFWNSIESNVTITSENGNVDSLLLGNSVEEIFIPEDNYNINIGSYKCILGDISFNTTQFQPPKMVSNFFIIAHKNFKCIKQDVIKHHFAI